MTNFLTPRQKQGLIEGAKTGNGPEEKAIYNEFDRLENRIRQLELAFEVMQLAATKSNYISNRYFK